MSTLREPAQNVVEYGLIVATIVLVVLLGVANFGSLIEPWFAGLAGRITTVGDVDAGEPVITQVALTEWLTWRGSVTPGCVPWCQDEHRRRRSSKGKGSQHAGNDETEERAHGATLTRAPLLAI
jgi:hypothetical protein